MSRTNSTRDAWHPQTRQDREDILRELEEILASPHFCNSKRYPALLQYIVEHTLAGKSDLLKERTLGVEVFDRPPSYDTNTDTVVRYTAGEVRKRLSLYYHELDRKPAIQISLPAGSYIPEFVHTQDEPEDAAGHVVSPSHELSRVTHPAESLPAWAEPDTDLSAGMRMEAGAPPRDAGRAKSGRGWLFGIVAVVAIALIAGFAWRYRTLKPFSPLNEFWAPLLHGQRSVMLCSGGVVFKEGNFSGVTTAGKDIEYPFVSSQIATAIARLSGLVERSGAQVDLQFSASTPLTVLRDQPLILLGGYNNQWTLRLLDSLPIHFAPEIDASIVDSTRPNARWARDHTKPYSSADDYALIARFRDPTTDSWVIVLAGLGRNGTEAAAQFVTSPRYMQMLRDQAGTGFANRNVEAVLKVTVIEGKTGAPSLLDVHVW